MKRIYLKYSADDEIAKQKIIKKNSHNLMKMWNKIVPIITENASDEDKESVVFAGKYIEQFHQFDMSSTSFRYPIDSNLDMIFDGEKRLNYSNLKMRVDELESFFGGVDGHLEGV